METKSFRVDINKIDEFLKIKAAFGWQLVSKDDLKPDHTILLNLQRDPKQVKDYYSLKALERQYESANRKFPVALVVFSIIGAALLVGYFLFKSSPYFAYGFLVASLTSFLIALIYLVLFLLILLKRKKIVERIIDKASKSSGLVIEASNKSENKPAEEPKAN